MLCSMPEMLRIVARTSKSLTEVRPKGLVPTQSVLEAADEAIARSSFLSLVIGTRLIRVFVLGEDMYDEMSPCALSQTHTRNPRRNGPLIP